MSNPPTLRILLVVDGELNFNTNRRFGLGHLVAALRATNYAYVAMRVTTAHRLGVDAIQNSAGARFNPAQGADIPAFRFDDAAQFTAAKYDVVWLIGIAAVTYGDPSPRLSVSELAVLTQFMNGGGGVFATGDHEDLGSHLCAEVPRVRSMRLWRFPTGYDYNTTDPPARGDAPPLFGHFRHDTLQPGANATYEFDDQSDDVPQTIAPRYKRELFERRLDTRVRSWPHPVLCGPRGVITRLPDHMHEGECVVPDDLEQSYAFDAVAGDEYPRGPNGIRIAPEIVATARTRAGH